jgi:uncharacterized metal-binding protein
MTTPLRALYGGTNRPNHLRLSLHLALVSTAWGIYHYPSDWPLWLMSGVACYAQELWATADRDLEENRKRPCWYWLPYGRKVRHRGWASHGLVVGTVIRLSYGWWWWLVPLWGFSPPLAMAWCGGALLNDMGHLALDL